METFTIQDLTLAGAVIGGTITVLQALIKLGDRLWSERNGKRPGQSSACGFDHIQLKESQNKIVEIEARIESHIQSLALQIGRLTTAIEADRMLTRERHEAMLREMAGRKVM